MDYYGYSDYGYTNYSGILGVVGAVLIFYVVAALIFLVIGIIQTIAFWKIFKKAGKGGWEAIIPFYGNWVLMKISGLNWWWFLFLFAPMVLSWIGLGWIGWLAWLLAMFNCYFNLAKKFNKSTGFAVCLTLFTPICASILGFSKNNEYDSSVLVSNNGVFASTGSTNNSNNVNYQNVQQPQPTYNNMDNTNQSVPNYNDGINNNVDVQAVQEYSFCGNCGTKLENGAKFCPNCGKQNM